MYYSHIGKGEFPFASHALILSLTTFHARGCCGRAEGEDRFIMMVTDSVALFALWEPYSPPCVPPLGPEASRQQVILDVNPIVVEASC